MKKIKFLSLITSFALTFGLLSCGGGDEPGGNTPTPTPPTPTEDTEAPKANNVKPANNAIIELDGNSEGKIEFSADFTDNVNLASYSIEIHRIVDSKSIESRSITRVAFDYPKQTWKIEGKAASVKEPIISIAPISNQAILTGKYKLTLVVTDAAGNETKIEHELDFRDA